MTYTDEVTKTASSFWIVYLFIFF